MKFMKVTNAESRLIDLLRTYDVSQQGSLVRQLQYYSEQLHMKDSETLPHDNVNYLRMLTLRIMVVYNEKKEKALKKIRGRKEDTLLLPQ